MSDYATEPADEFEDFDIGADGGEQALDPFADDFVDQVRAETRAMLAEALGELGQLAPSSPAPYALGEEQLRELAEADQAERELAEARGIAAEALEQLVLEHGQFDEQQWWKVAEQLLPEMQERYGDGRLAGLAALQAAAEALSKNTSSLASTDRASLAHKYSQRGVLLQRALGDGDRQRERERLGRPTGVERESLARKYGAKAQESAR